MGAGLEVCSPEALFVYLAEVWGFTDSCKDEETDEDVGPPEQNVFDWSWMCVFAFGCKSVCVHRDECRLYGNSAQNGYTTTITPSPSPSLSQFHL